MKYLIFWISILISSQIYSYNPNLLLLGNTENNGTLLIDINANKTIHGFFKQAIIYEKYIQPISDRDGFTYQSAIKKLIVDCSDKTIAIRGENYYLGKTSNSKLVKSFDDITLSHDGETGNAFYSFDDLDFKPLDQGKFYNKIFKNTCNLK